ncbi:MAG: deoxyribose-phosphate aldolase [Pseudonocardiaceae bacterium]
MSTQTAPPPAALVDVARNDESLRRFLHGLPGVEAVGLEARAAALATRAVRADARLSAIDTAIRLVDLTTLEGADTECSVRALCAMARRPEPGRPDVPAVAAVCVYPDRVAAAVHALAGSGVAVASVATAFPSGRSSLQIKLADTRSAIDAGATEIDMVIDRGAFLAGRYGQVFAEIIAVRQACVGARLKVILETGELATYDNVRRACWLAMLAGADFVKTSTGKLMPAATVPVVALMLQAVRDFEQLTGTRCGVKAAGGIRTTTDAIRYLVAVHEVAGSAWLSPRLFRFGASGLLGDLLRQRRAQREGHSSNADSLAVS